MNSIRREKFLLRAGPPRQSGRSGASYERPPGFCIWIGKTLCRCRGMHRPAGVFGSYVQYYWARLEKRDVFTLTVPSASE